MKAIVERIKNNPAVVLSLLVALFGVATAFGFELTKEQTGSITALVTVLVGFLIRSQVTPTRKVGALEDDQGSENGELMAGPASSVPTGDAVDVIPRDEDPVELEPGYDPHAAFDERGAVDGTQLLIVIAAIVVIVCGVIWLLGR